MKIDPDFSRRGFLASLAFIGAAMAFTRLSARAADEIDPKVASITSTTIGIDTHNHIDVLLTAADVPGPDLDLAGEMKRSGLSAICATFAVDYQKLGEPGVVYDRFLNALTSMDAQLARSHMQRAKSEGSQGSSRAGRADYHPGRGGGFGAYSPSPFAILPLRSCMAARAFGIVSAPCSLICLTFLWTRNWAK